MIFLAFILFVAAFFFMEFVAWFTHKHIMHGVLWSWHRSHHKVHDHALEMNDLFAVVFAAPAVACLYFGLENQWWPLVGIGAGITAYGIFYIGFHDLLVHQRLKIKYKIFHPYLKRMIRAHKVHHKKHSKEGCESFGFLIVNKKYEPK